MIKTKTIDTNLMQRFSIEQIAQLSEFLELLKRNEYTVGRIEDKMSPLFCFYQEYQTHEFVPENWEKHIQYYDVQYIKDGQETIYINPKSLQVTKPYNPNADCEIGRAQEGELVKAGKGDLVIFEPNEYHNAGNHFHVTPQFVQKYVVKVLKNNVS